MRFDGRHERRQDGMMGKGYDKATDVLEHCTVGFHVTPGRHGKRDHVRLYGAKEQSQITFPEGLHVGMLGWSDDRIPQVRAFVARVMFSLERDYGLTGWVLCPRTGVLCLLADDQLKVTKRKRGYLDRLVCCVETSDHDSRWPTYSVCHRPAVDGGLCTFHQSVVKRRADREAAYQAERTKEHQEADRMEQQTADLRELWTAVCDQRDVVRRGHPPRVGSEGAKGLDVEVLMMLLRELEQSGG